MARFDIHQVRGGVALDCQADILEQMPTRFVIPLEAVEDSLIIDDRLNPRFRIDDDEVVLVTQLAGTIRKRDLGRRIGRLSDERDQRAVQAALDLLTTGA
jgi:toxin CcdB